MALLEEFESSYASDESCEGDMLNRSLSVWRGWKTEDEPHFKPVSLDLHTASSIGQYDCVWSIIQRAEEDLNGKNVGGWTPLMYASYIGHDTIISLLLDAQCETNVKNKKGQTPLMLAASCGNESVAYLLIQAGADKEARDKKGWTALFHATYSGHQNMVKFLLDHKANTEVKEPARDFTPFMEAAVEGHEIIVQNFLLHGVDIDAKTGSGDTARSLALDKGHTKIVSLIDNHLLGNAYPHRSDLGFDLELSSSDEGFQSPMRRSLRGRMRGPNIGEGPEAFAKLMMDRKKKPASQPSDESSYPSSSYMSFEEDATPAPLRSRDLLSPITPEDHKLDSSARKDAPTIKSSSGSSAGLSAALGHRREISRDSSVDSEDSNTEFDRRSVGSDPGDRSKVNNSPVQQGQGRLIRGRNYNEDHNPKHIPRGKLSPAHSPGLKNPRERVSPSHSPGLRNSPKERLSPVISQSGYQGLGDVIKDPDRGPGAARPPPGFNFTPAAVGLPVSQPNASANQSTPISTNQMPAMNKNDKMPFGNAYQNRTYGQLPQLGHLTPEQSSTLGTASPRPQNTQKPPDPITNHEKVEEDLRPKDLEGLLKELGLLKYMAVFEEQDVDLTVFLTLTDSDLKEVGIKLFGPRRKMTNAIWRWHEHLKVSEGSEQAYANMLEARLQQLGAQLQKASDSSDTATNQLEQEKHLRSVMEGAYMEGRQAFQQVQHVAAENRQRCASLAEKLIQINHYQAELSRRFGAESQFSRSTGHGQLSLADSLHDQLRLTKDEQDIHPQIQRMPTQQIIRKLQQWNDELVVHVSVISKNTDRLLRGGIQAAQHYQRVQLPEGYS